MKKSNILLITLISIFVIITILVYNKFTMGMDNFIYKFIISFRSDSLTNFFKIVTKCANVKFCVMLLFIILIIFRNKKAIFLIITSIGVEILNLVAKFLVERDRPTILRLITVDNYSYPSGHAMMSMGIYGLLIYFIYKNISNKIIKYSSILFLSLLILLIGISRIYLGVHYFTDVVAGYILSVIYLIISIKIVKARGSFNV